VFRETRNLQNFKERSNTFVLAVTSTRLCNICFRNCGFLLLFLSIRGYLAFTQVKLISSDSFSVGPEYQR
jgi:hypothetical protein